MSLMVQNVEKSFHAKAQPWLGMLGMLSSLALTGGIGASHGAHGAQLRLLLGWLCQFNTTMVLNSHPPRHTFLGYNFKARKPQILFEALGLLALHAA